MMKNMSPVDTIIHTAWNEYLNIGSNFWSFANLLIDDTPTMMMRNKQIDVLNIEMILVVLYNPVASTTHKSVMIEECT